MVVDTIEIDDDNRIVVEYDEHTDNPRTDWDEPGHMFFIYGARDYLPPDGKETDYEYAFRYFSENLAGWAPDMFERWLRINFGTAYVETLSIHRDADALIYVTREDIEDYGWEGATEEEVRGYLRGSLEQYRAWANGEVYVVSHEQRAEYARAHRDTEYGGFAGVNYEDTMEVWETVDSIGGVYLTEEYTAENVAQEHFNLGTEA